MQTTPGQTKIGVLFPKGAEAVIADNFDGKPFGRPNDLVVDQKGGVYFTDPGPNAQPQNLAFAGPDKKTLYVVGRGAAFKIQLLAQGFKGRAK